MADTRVLTAHVPVELAEKIDRYAESMERSRGWIVKQALRDWVEWEERKIALSLEALKEAEQGHIIEHEDMLAWAKSLAADHPLPEPAPRKG